MIRFEDVVNTEFLEKYLPEIRSEYHVVDSDGKIQYGVLEKLFFSMNGEENPNRFIYALIHGKQKLIPTWNVPAKFRGNEEGLYKYCLDKKMTWENIFSDTVDENVLL